MGFCGRDETSFIIGISGPQRSPASSKYASNLTVRVGPTSSRLAILVVLR